MPIRRVIGLGLCVVDHVYRVDDLAAGAERTRYRERLVGGGGMVATALCQAARLGCRAEVRSLVSDDAEGRAVRAGLRAEGVGTRGLLRSPGHPSVAVVLVDRRSGARRFLLAEHRSAEARAPAFDLSGLDRHALLLIDGHFFEQALRAVRRAREVGATVVADFNAPRRRFLQLLPFVDYPIVPLEFARAYGGADPRTTVRRLREASGGTPVVTLGSRGGVYWDGRRVRRYAAHRPRAKVVDTTGAGDVFHGAFAAGLYHGRPLEAAIDLAARAAGLACTVLGARGRLMSPEEMGRRPPPPAPPPASASARRPSRRAR